MSHRSAPPLQPNVSATTGPSPRTRRHQIFGKRDWIARYQRNFQDDFCKMHANHLRLCSPRAKLDTYEDVRKGWAAHRKGGQAWIDWEAVAVRAAPTSPRPRAPAHREVPTAPASPTKQPALPKYGLLVPASVPSPASPRRPAPQNRGRSDFVQRASDSINARFGNMYKAFQKIDLDRSGTLSESELRLALTHWNLPVSEELIQELFASADNNGDHHIDYKEFVDALARDTVAMSAMGKRGMQSREAMGVGMFDELDVKYGRITAASPQARALDKNKLGNLYAKAY